MQTSIKMQFCELLNHWCAMIRRMSGTHFWRIVKMHLSSGLTQKWLAEEVGIRENSLSNMIRRGSMPKADTAYRIAHVLGLNLGVLLGIDHPDQLYHPEGGTSEEEPTYLVALDDSYEHDPYPVGDPADTVTMVRVLKRIGSGLPPDRLRAVQIRGDSMKDIHLVENDIAIYAHGPARNNGLYAIRLGREVLIKRLEFNNLDNTVKIISENSRYSPITAQLDHKQLQVLGKVVGWIHVHAS